MNERIHIKINEELKNKIQKQAKKEYTTMSGLIKRVMKEYLERGK